MTAAASAHSPRIKSPSGIHFFSFSLLSFHRLLRPDTMADAAALAAADAAGAIGTCCVPTHSWAQREPADDKPHLDFNERKRKWPRSSFLLHQEKVTSVCHFIRHDVQEEEEEEEGGGGASLSLSPCFSFHCSLAKHKETAARRVICWREGYLLCISS